MCQKIGSVVKQQGNVVTVMKLTCRSWNCPECCKLRRNQLVREAKEGKPERFITLTVNPAWFNSPEERAARLVAAWRLIRRRFIERRKGNVCEFMAVFELTKLGEPHLHIIQRGSFISQRWLSAQMKELMGAPVVDIRAVKGRKAVAEYVSKYISKRNIRIGTLKRYWRSKKYLAVSRAELRRRRNAGARFWIAEFHWKRYLKWIEARFPDDIFRVRTRGFEFEWWEDQAPPWLLAEEPMGVPLP